MNNSIRIKMGLISILTLGLSACGPQFVVSSKKVTPTDPNINEKNQLIITTPKEKTVSGHEEKITLGLLSTENLEAKISQKDKQLEVTGSLNLKTSDGKTKKFDKIHFSGELDEDGEALLTSKDQKSYNNIRIKALCLNYIGGNCDSAVLDLYVKDEGHFFATQVEANFTKQMETEKNEQPVKHDLDSISEEENPEPGLYVNSIYQDPSRIFLDTITKDDSIKKKVRPQNQSIGTPVKGRLENSTNLKDILTGYKIPGIVLSNEERNRHWGTYELISIITQMGINLQKIVPDAKLYVNDLSKQLGGAINTVHKSHQNGLDADIAYLAKNQTPINAFQNFVQNDKVTQNFLEKENFELLSTLVNSQSIDRIFVNKRIKQAFCKLTNNEELEKTLENDQIVETLRRIRVEKNHADHFHIRIKCSTLQPRCRMATEPPHGTGCDKI